MTRARKNGRWLILGCFTITIVLSLLIGSTWVLSQEEKFPDKPINLIIPFAPGGVIDLGARVLEEPLSNELKVAMVIRNMPGAGGMVAATKFSQMRPDGYNVFVASGGSLISGVIRKKPTFDPRKDFLPVGYVGSAPGMMSTHKDAPFKTFDEFLQYAKENPGKLKGGYAGPGGGFHLNFEAILMDSKIEARKIPHGGSGELYSALLGKHLDFVVGSLVSQMQYIKSGDFIPLLVTGKSHLFPKLPVTTEKGLPRASLNAWLACYVHSDTPKAAYNKLISALKAAVNTPAVNDKLSKIGFTVDYKNPQELSQHMESEWKIYSELLEHVGMKD